MKYLIVLTLILFASGLVAQDDYSIAASGKTIEFRNVGKLNITGTSDSKMTVSREGERKVDEKAKGLRKISATGRKDNTGFGLSVSEENGVIIVEQVGKECERLSVSVPNSASVSYEAVGTNGGKLTVSDFSGELDVSIQYHSVKLTNVTGPMAVNSIYGGITATFESAPTENVQLLSSYSDVDVTMPAAAKADVQLSTSYGSMYTDFELTVGGTEESNMHGGGGLNGKLNGGGPVISLTATYDDIYLRKGK
ncbi:hypothetical protein CEQ90_06430 [Lewinellaceae bacterium SD302]|nr:hypothetical protein CEQ90_06430 [Lewinellaceae bacterium SD302]